MAISIRDDENIPQPVVVEQVSDEVQSFEDMAASMPETAQGFLESAAEPTQPQATSEGSLLDEVSSDYEPPRKKTVQMSRKMKRMMDKFKAKAAQLPIMWFHQQARNNPEWELDKEEKELITDSIETVFEVLDINVEIEPLSWTFHSIWWVLSYPLVAFVFLFLTKKALVMEHEQGSPQDV
jgi:hypothetical protein